MELIYSFSFGGIRDKDGQEYYNFYNKYLIN